MKQDTLRTLTVVLLLQTFWPTLILAQTPSSASPSGIVTTLQGQATVTHVARPQEPVALQFRDPVFGRDRISTRERSIVRVLLGGKALVTVRELSELTITEELGRPSIVDLANGKIALAVARSRMRPGEAIEVRTLSLIHI